MTYTAFAFYFFSAVLLFSATMVISIRNPVKAALFLVLCFFSAACIWMTLEAEFLAITLILVYVGAVMVLFLFVVMMLDINLARLREGFGEYFPFGAIIAVLMVVELAIVLGGHSFSSEVLPRPEAHGVDYSNTRELGLVLYTEYVYPFEIAAAILLVAMIAAISLTLRKRPQTKYQTPSKQISVRRENRVRLVKMASEIRSRKEK